MTHDSAKPFNPLFETLPNTDHVYGPPLTDRELAYWSTRIGDTHGIMFGNADLSDPPEETAQRADDCVTEDASDAPVTAAQPCVSEDVVNEVRAEGASTWDMCAEIGNMRNELRQNRLDVDLYRTLAGDADKLDELADKQRAVIARQNTELQQLRDEADIMRAENTRLRQKETCAAVVAQCHAEQMEELRAQLRASNDCASKHRSAELVAKKRLDEALAELAAFRTTTQPNRRLARQK